MLKFASLSTIAAGLVLGMVAPTSAAMAQGQVIANDLSRCGAGSGPAVRVVISGIKAATGKIRLQSYRATKAEWLKKGKWLHRIEAPAKAGTMTFCLPVAAAGSYAIAARHDTNGNNETDISVDGGAMSNNPSINIFNLGKPSVTKTAFSVNDAVTTIQITMKYL
jgi:uncharacterized protein (DUF2141 family)